MVSTARRRTLAASDVAPWAMALVMATAMVLALAHHDRRLQRSRWQTVRAVHKDPPVQADPPEDVTTVHEARMEDAELDPLPNPQPRYGLLLGRDQIETVDWNEWMAHAPDRFLAAIHQGLEKPDQILAFVMREVFPALRWPPDQQSPYRPTWDALVVRVAQALPRVTADGRPILRALD